MKQDLVITGIGAVGPFGHSADALWDALIAPETSLAMDNIGVEGLSPGQVNDFDIMNHIKNRRIKRAPLISQYAMAAAAEAIGQAKLADKTVDKNAVSLVYGTGNGPSDIIERNLSLLVDVGINGIEPLGFQESVFNAPASLISIEYGFRGPLLALPMGSAAGGYALCSAADLVLTGQAPSAIAVASDLSGGLGSDAKVKLRFISPNDGKEACVRPFDRRANGSLSSEGSAAVVIETEEAAAARGATVLARLTGWAVTNDAQGVVPKRGYEKGIAQAMRLADPDGQGADTVIAGSYCTQDAEIAEAKAIRDYASEGSTPTVTNVRGAVGDCQGVTGLWNVIAAIKSLETGTVPHVIGCEEPKEGLGFKLPSEGDAAPTAVMCNNFWVSGLNTAARLVAA